MQYVHFRSYVIYFLLPWKIPEEISRQSVLLRNEREYLLYETLLYTYNFFKLEVDWPEICCLMEVSSMFYILHILHFYLVTYCMSKLEKWNPSHGPWCMKSPIRNFTGTSAVTLHKSNPCSVFGSEVRSAEHRHGKRVDFLHSVQLPRLDAMSLRIWGEIHKTCM